MVKAQIARIGKLSWLLAKQIIGLNGSNLIRLYSCYSNQVRGFFDQYSLLTKTVVPGLQTQALDIAGEHRLVEEIVSMMRSVSKNDCDTLRKIATYLKKHDEVQYLKECLLKLDDPESLIQVYITRQEFEEAFLLSKQNNDVLLDDINFQYGLHLALNDQFELAQQAFSKVKQTDESQKLLQDLIVSSIHQHRYEDASYFVTRFLSRNAQVWPEYVFKPPVS